MKRIMAIGRKTPTFDQLIVDPDFCPHESTQWQTVGGYFTTCGEADDDVRDVLICLDCGAEVTPADEPSGNVGHVAGFGGER